VLADEAEPAGNSDDVGVLHVALLSNGLVCRPVRAPKKRG